MVQIDQNELLDILRKGRNAYENKEYESSYRFLKEALSLDPTNTYANNTIKIVAKKIRAERKQELKRRIEALDILWAHKEYSKLLLEYEKLNDFYPGYLPVVLQIARLKKLKTKEEEIKAKEYKKKIKKEIKNLHKDKKYLEALSAIKDVEKYFAGESWLLSKQEKIKHDYVIDQLSLRDELLEKQEYEKLYGFLVTLYKIFPEERIKKYIDQTESLILENRRYKNRVFISESLDLINSLYNQGKFEESMKVCEELFALTGKNNLKAKTFYARSKNANEKEMNKQIYNVLDSKISTLEKEYLQNKEDFIVL